MDRIKEIIADWNGSGNWLIPVFAIVILVFLVVDLGFLSRGKHRVSMKSALLQSMLWVVISVSFGSLIYFYRSHDDAFSFLTAYVTEYSLSVDNIFVFILIFRHFKVDERYHHKILYYGVIGAVVFRGIFIGLGNVIVAQFHWVLYFFGAFLLYTGFKMLFSGKEDEFEPDQSWMYKQLRRRFRFHPDASGGSFITRIDGKLYFTTLLLVVLLIETTDIIFAVDSIPAVFSISQDAFIVYTSNIFAVMGLRAMYFLLEGSIDKFHLLQKGISFVLMFIGVKMLMEVPHSLHDWFGWNLPEWTHLTIPNWLSFTIIISILAGSILMSLVVPVRAEEPTKEK
ncbi:MAG: TerC/Alx family metal homeostasis membrane protein [Bacteroidia bacterium]|nr:TerC/Alx family metal homeostasis membrane protein [Bacteroidia bacterium]